MIPHEAASRSCLFHPLTLSPFFLKSCITKSEGVSAHGLQIFEDDTGEITTKDDDIIALLADTYPGNVEEQSTENVYKETQAANLTTSTKKFRCQRPSGM